MKPPPVPAAPPPPVVVAPLVRMALPENLLVLLRWQDPDALLATLDAWSPGMRSLAAPWWQAWLASFSADIDPAGDVEALVVLDQTIDPPAPSWALSFALREGPRARPTSPAVALPVRAPNGWMCEDAPALGEASRRWVCAASERELAALVPAATRAAPLVPPSDRALTIRIDTRPLTRLDLTQLRRFVDQAQHQFWPIEAMNERITTKLGGFSDALRDELVFVLEDLDGTMIDLSPVTGEPALALRVASQAAPTHSRLMRLMLGSGAVGLMPSSLWELPKDSRRASFWWSFDAQPLAELREPLGALLRLVLDFRGLSWRQQLQAQRLIENLPLPEAPLVLAHGRREPSARTAEHVAEAENPTSLGAGGWWLCQAGGDIAAYRRYGEELATAFSDPVLGAQLVRLLRSGFGDHWSLRSLKQRAPRHRGLVPGSFVLELELKPAQPRAPGEDGYAPPATTDTAGPKRYLIVAGPDPAAPLDGGLKLAWGDDEAFLTLLLAGGRGGLKHADTLAAREGLSALVRQRALMGGFSNLESWLSWFVPVAPESRAEVAPGTNTPHGARTPILYSVTPNMNDQGFVFDAKLGRETVEDLKFLLTGAPAVERPASGSPAAEQPPPAAPTPAGEPAP
ncbi:MAG: hypothetical protein ABW217_08565 [Polyangiaceae bacterium]